AIQDEISESVGEDLSAKEQRALKIGRLAARMSLSEMLDTDGEEPVIVGCKCGDAARSKERESRSVVTLAGTQKIVRRKYHCRSCGAWVVARDKTLGIGRGNYSVGVVALASEIAAGFPFEASEDFLSRRFGLDLCYKQVQRLSERTGERLAQEERKEAALLAVDKAEVSTSETPSVMTISADGLMVHCDGAWSEMKCGSVISPEYGRSTIATMERSEGFGELLYLEARRRGLENAREVVFVADGAAWIWKLAAHHFDEAVEIVDWYHATQHLWEVANCWYSEGSKRAKAWVKANKTRLMEDGVDRVISSIKQWRPTDEDAEKTKRENLHYFATNAHRMLYATFELNDFYIGSGSVESACKQYGQGRLKGAGMRWKTSGLEAIAHLRSAVLNRKTDNILEGARIAA
ncbi:MAG: ISKra4 family transposase, partial [Anaerolineae bacterium]|nr:ISKra4 family transposase [Armatimonadota bacterium]NIQ77305.1 ISKra4 family transposase [Anaerolineae bacterium]